MPARYFLISLYSFLSSFSFAQHDSLLNDPLFLSIGCSQFFDEHEKLDSPAKTFLITKAKKTVSLESVLKKTGTTAEGDHVLADMDDDGKKELVTWTSTSGTNCCEIITIYRRVASNKFQHAARLFGTVCIKESGRIYYDFYAMFGQFFTCYTCAYEDTSEVSPLPVQSIELKFAKGKLAVVPGDSELKSVITDNLDKLSEQPYQPLNDEVKEDNGLRKEFALNLAIFYYSFGKNLAGTQRMFNRYYKFHDAKRVWQTFLATLNEIKKQNTF